MEHMDREELKKNFSESLEPLISDKEALEDKEVVDFYMDVCCVIADEYVSSLGEDKALYSDIEDLIIRWSLDDTKTAGHLTRQIMELIKSKGENEKSI